MNEFNYSILLENLSDAILRERNPDKKEKLTALYETLSEKITLLIEKNISQDEEKYNTLIDQFEKADKSLKQYSKNSRKLSDTLNALSKVIAIINDFV